MAVPAAEAAALTARATEDDAEAFKQALRDRITELDSKKGSSSSLFGKLFGNLQFTPQQKKSAINKLINNLSGQPVEYLEIDINALKDGDTSLVLTKYAAKLTQQFREADHKFQVEQDARLDARRLSKL